MLTLTLLCVNYRKGDVCLCLGTSLQIVPCGKMPLLTKKNGGKIVIVNLQPTKQDKHAFLKIHTYVDTVMTQLCTKLGVKIPEWTKPTVVLQSIHTHKTNRKGPTIVVDDVLLSSDGPSETNIKDPQLTDSKDVNSCGFLSREVKIASDCKTINQDLKDTDINNSDTKEVVKQNNSGDKASESIIPDSKIASQNIHIKSEESHVCVIDNVTGELNRSKILPESNHIALESNGLGVKDIIPDSSSENLVKETCESMHQYPLSESEGTDKPNTSRDKIDESETGFLLKNDLPDTVTVAANSKPTEQCVSNNDISVDSTAVPVGDRESESRTKLQENVGVLQGVNVHGNDNDSTCNTLTNGVSSESMIQNSQVVSSEVEHNLNCDINVTNNKRDLLLHNSPRTSPESSFRGVETNNQDSVEPLDGPPSKVPKLAEGSV